MQQHSRAHCLLCLVLVATCCCCTPAIKAPHAAPASNSQHIQQRQSTPSRGSYTEVELLLRQIVEECSNKQDTVLQLDGHGQLVVLQHLPPDAPCPLIDIALRGSERGVGMCTDVALYVIHTGARIIPLLQGPEMAAYNSRCSNSTARMFLESMYHEWLSLGRTALHMMQVNSEHMFMVHQLYHAAINIFLCKTRFCQKLVRQYVAQFGFNADVWYTGHTSSDVLVEGPGASASPLPSSTRYNSSSIGSTRNSSSSSSSSSSFVDVTSGGLQEPWHPNQQHQGPQIHADYSQFLHVKGKSGLKHTKQLLQCWKQHPEFPLLTVVGHHHLDEGETHAVLHTSNVLLLPTPVEDKQQREAVDAMAQRLAAAAAAASKAADDAAKKEAQEAATAKAAQQKAAAAAAAAVRQGAGTKNNTPQQAAKQAAAKQAEIEAAVAMKAAAEAKAAAQAAAEQAAGAHEAAKGAAAAADAAPRRCRQLAEAQHSGQQAAAARNTELANRFPHSSSEHRLQQHQQQQPLHQQQQQQQQQPLHQQQRQGTDAAQQPDEHHMPRQLQHQRAPAAPAAGKYKFPFEQLKWAPSVLQSQALLSYEDIRQLQANIGIHLCPSEREGFGHYINEARAAGALIISTDHPPMNELVHADSGYLIRPSRTSSYTDQQALGGFAHINAFVTPGDICKAVKEVLAMSVEERMAKGRRARRQYLLGKSVFVHKLKRLQGYVSRWRRGELQGSGDKQPGTAD